MSYKTRKLIQMALKVASYLITALLGAVTQSCTSFPL